RLDMLAKFSSLRRQRQAFVGSREQFGAELAFQQRDVAADGRMAGAQLARRRGKATGFCCGDKGLAEVPIHRRLRDPRVVRLWCFGCSILNSMARASSPIMAGNNTRPAPRWI